MSIKSYPLTKGSAGCPSPACSMTFEKRSSQNSPRAWLPGFEQFHFYLVLSFPLPGAFPGLVQELLLSVFVVRL